MPIVLLILSLVFLYGAVSSAYFDEWWHIAGRVETFFTLPHALLYASIFLNGMTILSVVFIRMWKAKTIDPRRITHHKNLALAGSGALIQLISGVSDNFYHQWIGFDVTIWSPPHLGAVYGGVIFGLGLAGLWKDSVPGLLGKIGGLCALGASCAIVQFGMSEFVVSDRFDEIPSYFAMMSVLMIGLILVVASLRFGKMAATITMGWYFIFELGLWMVWNPVYSGYYAVEYPFPQLWIVAALALDMVRLRFSGKWSLPSGLVAFAVIVHLGLFLNSIEMTRGEWIYSIACSLPVAWIAAWLGTKFAAFGGNLHVSGKLQMAMPAAVVIAVAVAGIAFVPVHSYAHTGDGYAPDLHPIWVMIEYVAILSIGHGMAGLLTWSK